MRNSTSKTGTIVLAALALTLLPASLRAQRMYSAAHGYDGSVAPELRGADGYYHGRSSGSYMSGGNWGPGYGPGHSHGCSDPGHSHGCCEPGCSVGPMPGGPTCGVGCCDPGCNPCGPSFDACGCGPSCGAPGFACGGCSPGFNSCCRSCCADPCWRNEGWLMGGELLYLKPHSGVGTGVSDSATDIIGEFPESPSLSTDPDFEPSYRVYVGYTRCDGLGFRVTYWEFDQDHEEEDDEDDLEVEQEWNTYYFDFELTSTTNLGCHWDATVSGGIRYVSYSEQVEISNGELGDNSSSTWFEDIGLTLGAELRHRVNCCFGFYGRARWTIVMGDEELETEIETFDGYNGFNGPIELETTQRNDVRMIYEAAAGGELIMPMCCGGYYYIRGGVEMSYWDGFGLNTTLLDVHDSTSAGFGGFTFSVGMVR